MLHKGSNYWHSLQKAASRVLVERSIADKFISAAKDVFEAATRELGQDPFQQTTQHGPVVDKQQFDRIMSYIEKGNTSAQLVTGGKRKGTRGCFIEPTLFVDPAPDSEIWTEEIFGPVLTVKTFETEEEAIKLANDSLYGLAGKSATPGKGAYRSVALTICHQWCSVRLYDGSHTSAASISGSREWRRFDQLASPPRHQHPIWGDEAERTGQGAGHTRPTQLPGASVCTRQVSNPKVTVTEN